jgi:hypothetical protein
MDGWWQQNPFTEHRTGPLCIPNLNHLRDIAWTNGPNPSTNTSYGTSISVQPVHFCSLTTNPVVRLGCSRGNTSRTRNNTASRITISFSTDRFRLGGEVCLQCCNTMYSVN